MESRAITALLFYFLREVLLLYILISKIMVLKIAIQGKYFPKNIQLYSQKQNQISRYHMKLYWSYVASGSNPLK